MQNEAEKIKHRIVPWTRGYGLDLGCGPEKSWPHFIGIDSLSMFPDGKRPDMCRDARDLSVFSRSSLDFVWSSFMLHRHEEIEAILREWFRVLKPGGRLGLYLPLPDSPPRIDEFGNPEKWFRRSADDIIAVMKKFGGWDLAINEKRTRWGERAFFQVYTRASGANKTFSWEEREKKVAGRKKCLISRYGAIGDLIQTSSVLPYLKGQGYHITFNCHPNGPEVLGHDPNIDEFIIQDPNQVPNDDRLGKYWAALEREYDRCINFSESTEGTLLAIPGRRTHALSHAARHLLMDVNYLDFMHGIANVTTGPRTMFYPTEAEKTEMSAFRQKLGAVPIVMWSLAGSSIHKVWPWTDHASVWLLQNTNVKLLFVGDKECQILETAVAQKAAESILGLSIVDSDKMKLGEVLKRLKDHWGEQRIICRSGNWSIRQSLTFLSFADCVIGPETGVLNAASMMPMPKVVFLSHSSDKNLTRDWVNCTPLAPKGLACYPCHRLHYSTEFCNISEETSAAMCAHLIKPEEAYEAIVGVLNLRKAA